MLVVCAAYLGGKDLTVYMSYQHTCISAHTNVETGSLLLTRMAH